jgi:hypothetical protein
MFMHRLLIFEEVDEPRSIGWSTHSRGARSAAGQVRRDIVHLRTGHGHGAQAAGGRASAGRSLRTLCVARRGLGTESYHRDPGQEVVPIDSPKP